MCVSVTLRFSRFAQSFHDMALASTIIKACARGKLFHDIQQNATRFAVKNLNSLSIRKRSDSHDLRTQKEITDYVAKEVDQVKITRIAQSDSRPSPLSFDLDFNSTELS